MITPYDLPDAVDGRTPRPMTVAFQLRRVNRIASALWEHKDQIGEDPAIRIAIDADSSFTQVQFAIYSSDRAVAEQLAGRLNWDAEADVKRVGMTRQHWWAGMVGGFRAQLVWIEEPPQIDTQGREQLPADVGIGDPVADAGHVRLQQLAGAASGFEVVDHPGIGVEVRFTSDQLASQSLASTRPGFNPIRRVVIAEGPGQ